MAYTPFVATIMPAIGACLCLISSRGKSNEEITNDLSKTVANWYFNGLLVGVVMDVANMFF
jgi:hypothetical protein